MVSEIRQFFRDHGIPRWRPSFPTWPASPRQDHAAEKFAEDGGMRLPESVFLQTVTGDYPPETGTAMSRRNRHRAQGRSEDVRRVPWAAEPTAQVIHDCFYSDGRRVSMAPRHVLRNIVELYAQRGWEPIVAPELRVYLVEQNKDADYPLSPRWAVPGAPSPAGSPTASPGQRVRSAVR